jgi:hypothetical protein
MDQLWKVRAARMFQDGKIPDDVYARLAAIDNLCGKDGGQLRSRQVIATVITQLRTENPSLVNETKGG